MQPRTVVVMAILIIAPIVAGAQSGTSATSDLSGRCASAAAPSAQISPGAKNEAQRTADRAQAASIQGDNAAATDLYQKAAQLDPSNARIAYALGREYQVTRDVRAMREYCRFLTLAPTATEAADVRQRIAALSLLGLPLDTAVVRIPVTTPNQMPAPGTALLAGLVVPGLGQFTTHRPAFGLLVMAASAVAAVYGLQSQNVTSQVTLTAIDPLGHAYQYQKAETRSERPHFAVGVGAAAAISVIAALEAFGRARSVGTDQRGGQAAAGAESRLPGSASPVLTVGDRSIGFGLAFR